MDFQWKLPLLGNDQNYSSGLSNPLQQPLINESPPECESTSDFNKATFHLPKSDHVGPPSSTSSFQYGRILPTRLPGETSFSDLQTETSFTSFSSFETNQDVNNDVSITTPIDDIEPSFTVPVGSLDKYINMFELEFLNLKNQIFEKQQCRKQKIARQRIMDGKVTIAVRSSKEVQTLVVWVRREEHAATICKDNNGDTLLGPVIKLQRDEVVTDDITQAKVIHYKFQVDLDSVYDGKYEPVYKLARVETSERNKFQLVAQAVFTDQEYSERINSDAFLVRTQRCENEKPIIAPWSSCPSSYKRVALSSSPPIVSEPDSSVAPEDSPNILDQYSRDSPCSASSRDHLIVKHLDAQRANIDELNVTYINTRRGDIAYHVELNGSHSYKKLEEGQVVAFLAAPGGHTVIEPLTTKNASQAVLAGVITRSAWVQCESPKENKKGKTDIVCVIGMVPVNIVGTVRTGDRVYSSGENPGCGIPESHLPLGYSFTSRSHTLLGMAMESKTPRSAHQTESMLVKCFVCIVLGINNQQLNKEVENVMESMEMDISVKILKSSKKNWRRTYSLVCGVVLLLGLLGAFLYEYFFPGSALRYWMCKQGSIPGHELHYLHPDEYGKDVNVLYIKFGWTKLQQKMHLGFPRLQGVDVDYYMNLDVCAYGGTGARTGLSQDPTKRRLGCYVIAANEECTTVYCYMSSCWNICKSKNLTCIPPPPQLSRYAFSYNKNHSNVCNKRKC